MQETETSEQKQIKDIYPAAIEEHFKILSRIGNLGKGKGFLRAAWSNEESAAIKHVAEYAQDFRVASLQVSFDSVGNLYVRNQGEFTERVMFGSHLDTVPNGGNYDGAVGVIAGLEAIKVLSAMNNKQMIKLQKGLELVVWRAEESATFGSVYNGSRAAFGVANPKILDNKFNGITLEDAIKSQGFDPSCIRERKAALSTEHLDSISDYLELHIEQGKVLEVDKKEIGIVTGIRGASRYLIVVEGEFDHSGATPMGEYRKDANLAIAYIQVRLDTFAHKFLSDGYDLVQTVGVVNSDRKYNEKLPEVFQNAQTKVSGFGYFTLDVRSSRDYARSLYLEPIPVDLLLSM